MAKPQPLEPIAVSITEAARLIGLSKWTIYKMGREGVFNIRRLAGTDRSVILYRDLLDYMSKSERIESHQAANESHPETA